MPDPLSRLRWQTTVTPHASSGRAGNGGEVAEGVNLYFEGVEPSVAVNGGTNGLEIVLEAGAFEFVSLAVAFPHDLRAALNRDQLVGLSLGAVNIAPDYLRINLETGATVVQDTLSCHGMPVWEFDLYYLKTDPEHIRHGWFDLIWQKPQLGPLTMSGIGLHRRLRASF